MIRPTGNAYAAEAGRQKGRMLAAVLVDMDRLDDPAGLIDESPLFWEVAAKHATVRLGLTVRPPTGADGVQAVIDAVRRMRADRDTNDDPFAGFPREVV